MPAAVMRWVRQWRRDLRAALKETDAPIDRVPTDGGRTIDYTLTKWTFENIHRAPLWRRDEAILRRERQNAKNSELRASERGEDRTLYQNWKLWTSQLAKAAKITLGEKRGATPGVVGIRRNRRPGPPVGPEVKKLRSMMGRDKVWPEEILEGAGVAPTWRNLRSVGHLSRRTLARIQLAVSKNPKLKKADLPTLRCEAARIRSKEAREALKTRR